MELFFYIYTGKWKVCYIFYRINLFFRKTPSYTVVFKCQKKTPKKQQRVKSYLNTSIHSTCLSLIDNCIVCNCMWIHVYTYCSFNLIVLFMICILIRFLYERNEHGFCKKVRLIHVSLYRSILWEFFINVIVFKTNGLLQVDKKQLQCTCERIKNLFQ